VLERIQDHFAGRPLTKLPKVIAEQQAEEEILEEVDPEDGL
jgi:hypothetical protein